MFIFSRIKSARRRWSRISNPVNWHQLRSLEPVSQTFGLDRGTPIDRYYIEKFLGENRQRIRGNVLEIAESTYSRKFGEDVLKYEVLHTQAGPHVTVVGDLTKRSTLPENQIDCFICTQTFNFIYEFRAAIEGAYYLLKPGGFLLATLAGISQISRYDMDRWGDFWRFTSKSCASVFGEVFGSGNVSVQSFGNVLAATSFLQGISMEELTMRELDYQDEDYQLLLTVVAQKNN